MKTPLQQLQEWLPQGHQLLSNRQGLLLRGIDEEAAGQLAEQLASWYLSISSQWNCGCILLRGDLGAGKTHFSQHIIASLAQMDAHRVESPTYAYLIAYDIPGLAIKVFHFDLYRLKSESELHALGLEEVWEQPGLSLIEWPDCAVRVAPWPRLSLTLQYESPHLRSWQCDWHTSHVKEIS